MFCKPKFENFNGNGPRSRVRGANKMALFRKNPFECSGRWPWNRTKFSVRFRLAGPSRPMLLCALAVWDCRMPHQLLLFLSLLRSSRHFRNRRALQGRFRLLQYVLQLRTPVKVPNNHRSVLRTVSSESLKNVYFVRRKQRVKRRGKDEKTPSRVINAKVVFVLLCRPFQFPASLSTLPRVKQFCCCLVDYQSRSTLPCRASQRKKDVLPRQGHFVTLLLESNGVPAKIFLNVPMQSLHHRNWSKRK